MGDEHGQPEGPESGGTGDVDAIEEWIAYGEDLAPLTEPVRRLDPLTMVAILLAIATGCGLFVLRPTGSAREAAANAASIGVSTDFHPAKVESVSDQPCEGVESLDCSLVTFELTGGPDKGYVYTQEFPESASTPQFGVGQAVVLSYRAPNAVIRDITQAPCGFDAEQTCYGLSIVLERAEGPVTLGYELPSGATIHRFLVGEHVIVDLFSEETDLEVLAVSPVDPALQYQFADFQRRGTLLWLAILFAVVVVGFGGWRGAASLIGLAASVVVLLMFVLPAILDGRSPVLVAVVGASAIAFLALYTAHGFNRMTTVAVIGMLAALGLTAALSAVVVVASRFTGFAGEESSLLSLFGTVDVRGLVLAGIVLGAAGALDDVTVTQASAVWELRAANASLGSGELFRRGLRIGRDHIASTVNTLLLAYAGAALPLLVLFVLSQESLGSVANSEVVAIELVRTLVGSIGLVAAVPFTTWLAALVAAPTSGGGHQH